MKDFEFRLLIIVILGLLLVIVALSISLEKAKDDLDIERHKKRELENKIKNEFRKESVEKIEFPSNGYMRYYQRANNKTKMLDVRITKPDEFTIGVELEKIDREIGYII